MTLVAFVCFLIVLFAAGMPFLRLLPSDSDGRRVLLSPLIGFSIFILGTSFLASLGFTGRTIGLLSLCLIALAVVLSLVRVTRSGIRLNLQVGLPAVQEWLDAVPAAGVAFCGVAIIAWPLFYQGYRDFWGFANPDEAYYMTIVDHLDNHRFSQPPPERVHTSEALTDTSSILTICYLLPTVSRLTAIQSNYLFGVLCAVMIFLMLCSVYLFSRLALSLDRRIALVPPSLLAVSSMAAQTFYLHSLGALAGATLCPLALALTVLYVRERAAVWTWLLAALLGAMLFGYYPGFALLGLIVGSAIFVPLVQGKLPVRSVLLLALLTGGILTVTYFSQAVTVFHSLFSEVFSRRLAAVSDNEILLQFARMLTEELMPILWGFRTVGTAPLDSGLIFGALVAGGALVTVLLLFALRLGLREKAHEFSWSLAAGLAAIAVYFFTRNGYGVFKLVTWLNPLFIAGISLSMIALLRSRKPAAKALGVFFLAGFGAMNAYQTARLSAETLGVVHAGGQHSYPELNLADMRTLSNASDRVENAALLIALPDSVLQRWSVPFILDPRARLLPVISLNTEDSDAQSSVNSRNEAISAWKSGFVLHPNAGLQDIVPESGGHVVWQNRVFALSHVRDLHDVLILGAGWYRREVMSPGDLGPRPFRWLRKRAEVLLFNASPGAHRLVLTVMAGYGNQSPIRHLELFCNGRKFDDVLISGYSRFETAPLPAGAGPAAIEIRVKEDAEPLPRSHALWNAWVPKEPRRLNIAVFEIHVTGDSDPPVGPQVDFRSARQFDAAFFDGIYPDRWMGQSTSIKLALDQDSKELRIRGLAPQVPAWRYPMSLEFRADGVSLGASTIGKPGQFDVSAPLPRSLRGDGHYSVSFSFQPNSKCFSSAADPRCLGFRLDDVGVARGEGRSAHE